MSNAFNYMQQSVVRIFTESFDYSMDRETASNLAEKLTKVIFEVMVEFRKKKLNENELETATKKIESLVKPIVAKENIENITPEAVWGVLVQFIRNELNYGKPTSCIFTPEYLISGMTWELTSEEYKYKYRAMSSRPGPREDMSSLSRRRR